MPPGAVSLDDVDLDQVSVDFVLNCARKGTEQDTYSTYMNSSYYISSSLYSTSLVALFYYLFPFIFFVGGLLELSEAIRDYHDSTLFPHMVNSDMHIH